MSDNDIIRRNEDLDKKIEGSDVVTRLRRVDRMVKWLAFSVALDMVLSIGLAVLGIVAYDISKSAKTAASLARINCLSANQTRLQSQQLWDYVLTFPAPSNETAAARRERLVNTAKFRAYIKVVFAPRDCSPPALARQVAHPPTRSGATPAPIVTPTATPQRTPSSAPQVSVTVVVTPNHEASSSATPPPTSHSPPPPTSPSPSPSPSKKCTVRVLICVPPLGAQPWQRPPNALNANTITVPGGTITPTQIESLVSALQPSDEVQWVTQVLATPTLPPLVRLLAPWMSPTRVVISIQSSSWAIRVAFPLTSAT